MLFTTINSAKLHGLHLAICVGAGSFIWLLSLAAISMWDDNISRTVKQLWNVDIPAAELSVISKWSSYGKKRVINTFMFSFLAFLDLMIIDIIPSCGENNVGYYAACLTIASLIFYYKKNQFFKL